jgi:SAM-dependent methyltransferase
MNFKDYFSKHSTTYAKFRPQYPPELFDYLSQVVAVRDTAWDCATGNGQAAISLVPFFQKVWATDASAQQIAQAIAHPQITYSVAQAEKTHFEPESIDLITVAQALHWFNLPEFYLEVNRVLKPGGILAVWCYSFMEIDPEISPIIARYYSEIVGSFWPPERKLIEEEYQNINFPFPQLAAPKFKIETALNLSELIGYLESWSSSQRYFEQHQSLGTDLIKASLAEIWGDPHQRKPIYWPIHLKLGAKAL